MLPYQYTYLCFSVLMLFIWLILFSHRKDLRKQMLIISSLMAVNTVIAQYFFWTHDWWQAQTITGTRIGVEDLISGFVQGGIAAVLFPELFKEKNYSLPITHKHLWVFFILVWNIFIAFLYWGLGLNSGLATNIVFAIFSLVVVFERRDLIFDALVSGLIMCAGFILLWFGLKYVSPGWIEQTWFFSKLSGLMWLGIPVEDLAYYFLYGFFIGPLYEFIRGQGWRKYHF